MKFYCVDVRGFNVDKKKLVVSAIDDLIGTCTNWSDRALSSFDVITSINAHGELCAGVSYSSSGITGSQTKCLISFNDLMLEAGFNYEDNGVECFKLIDLPERAATENKPASNKTRPRITREQYDAVMAQSDKRTFTKALDDLLAIEKEQLLDESAIRIKQLEKENEHLEGENKLMNNAINHNNKQLILNSETINQLEIEQGRFVERIKTWHTSWLELRNANDELEAKLERHRRLSGVLSLLLISSVAAQLAVIFLR